MDLQDIQNSIEKHMPFDREESRSQEAILHLIGETPSPALRRQFEPGHLTASSFVVTRDTARIVLVFHRKLKRWLQPGGHIDPVDSSILEAAVREAREETGLTLDPAEGKLFDLDVHTIPATQAEPQHRHFDVRYLFFVDEQALVAGSDVGDTKWIDIAQWKTMENDSGLRRVTEKLRSS